MARFQDKLGVSATKGFFQEITPPGSVPGYSSGSITNSAHNGVVTEIVQPIKYSDGATNVYTVYVPAGAVITQIMILNVTPFNAGTTNQLKIGSTSGGTDILGLTNLNTPASPLPLNPIAAETVRAGTSPAGVVGSIFITNSLTGAAASAGSGYVTIRYANPNPYAAGVVGNGNVLNANTLL